VTRLSELLTAAGRAHHDATGGPDHDWATWYAEFLQHEIDPWLGIDPSVDNLSSLLRMAADKHRDEADDRPWPGYYAELMLATLENEAERQG
jgi:hypothetical protein